MKRLAQTISALALAATLLPAVLFFTGGMDAGRMKTWMVVSALAWFAATPFWMEHKAGE